MNDSCFLDNIEKVYKVASEKIEKQLEEDTQAIVDKLQFYFLKLIDLKDSDPEKFKSLLVRSRYTNKKNPQNIPFLISEYYEPSLEGIQVYCNILFKIWKKSYDNELENTAYYTVSVVEKILQNLLSRGKSGKDYLTISNYYITLLQNINFEISKTPQRFSYSTARASYMWFFHIVFNPDFNLKLITDLQIPLFVSVRLSINNNNKKLFLSFIGHIINGSWDPLYAMLPDIDYKTKFEQHELGKEYEKAKSALLTESAHALTLQDFQKVTIAFDSFTSVLEKYTTITNEIKQNIISEYKGYLEKQFKYRILQQTVIWLGSYCLFQKKYDYIEDLLYFNQPKDSPVHWSNKDINPLDIHEIITLFHRRYELDRNITFLWDDHHEFLTYYNTYLGILLCNAINQNQRIGQTWRNEYNPNFKNLGKTVQEIESFRYSLEDLSNIIKSFKNRSNLIKDCGLSEIAVDNAIILLDNVCTNIERQKQEIKVSAEIDPEKAIRFIENVYENYRKGGAIKNIINFYKPISIENEAFPGEQFLSFGINEVTMKSFFAKNDEGMYVGWGNAFASNFTFNENINLRRILAENCQKSNDKIDQSMIIQELEKIGDLNDKVLIFSNIYPSYEIFGSNTGFISIDEIPVTDRPEINEFVGRYNGADVFTFYDDTKWKQLLILTKFPDAGIGSIKYYVPTEKTDFNIKEHFYWKILDLNVESDLVNSIIKEQPIWLLQQSADIDEQKKFLCEQVNVIILFKMNLELPEGFRGWFFNLQ